MENQPTSSPKIITRYNFQQAIMSVAIGFAVSLLTILFQLTVEWLQSLPAELPGAGVGMLTYWKNWRYNHFV